MDDKGPTNSKSKGIFVVTDLLFETVSCVPGWLQTHDAAKDDTEP